MKGLATDERRHRIAERVSADGTASIADLARMFGVSKVTARGDVAALAQMGKLQQVRGSAVAVLAEPTGPVGRRPPGPEDAALIREAQRLVTDGDSIALDSSDLGFWLADALHARRDLRVVAGAVDTAQRLAVNASNRVILAGSIVSEDGVRLRLHPDERSLHGFRVRLALLCCSGCDASGCLFAPDPDTAELKRALIRAAQTTVLLLRGSMPDPSEVAPFGELRSIQKVLTTQVAPPLQQLLLESGASVTICRSEARGALA